MTQAHFGVMVPQIKRTWAETRSAALDYEAMGFDSIWVNDHLYGPASPQIPILEAWSLVASLAAITERVQIGTLVTPMGMRNPAQLAKVIATVDHIAGGRVIPGFGAGWLPREYTDFGMPFLEVKERLQQLREGLQLMRRMWSADEDEVTFDGRHFRTENVVTLPKPERQPRVMVGGAGEKVTMRIAAEYADIWNNNSGNQGDIARKVEVLRQHCADLGRDPAEVTVSQQCLVTIAEDEATANAAIENAQKLFRTWHPEGPMALSGTPGQVAQRVQAHLDAGCTMFNIEFFGRDPRVPAALFAKEVIPQFR